MGEKNLDQELVERVQNGDKAAFDILVRKYEHKLANVVGRYIRDSSEVLDVVQESFIKAYRALPNFRGDSAFYTWLYRIGINTAKNYLVASSRRPPGEDVDAQDAEQFDGGAGLREYATPERIALQGELADTIVAAIDELPEELRNALVLRELDGLSYEEIATAMDCPIGTVRSRIFRARDAVEQRIRPLLEGSDSGEY
ncbi:MAG: RNA polymerase sigma factor RpoE [Thiogranum sp.]|nr:RNA polymerase sigma factor RpoE [Thiogranum sp.]